MTPCEWLALTLIATIIGFGNAALAFLWGRDTWRRAPTLTAEELREHLDEVRWKRRYLDGQEERRR